MKIKIPRSITRTEEREIEVGEKGDFVLIRAKGRDNYSFGRLEDVIYFGEAPSIEFNGDSYSLETKKVFGVEFSSFRKRPKIVNRCRYKYFDAILIEEAVIGLDNIISFLERHQNRRYKGHADLIRKIAEAQK